MKDVKYDYSGLLGILVGTAIGCLTIFVLCSMSTVDKENVPKNVPVKNEWFCIPSPQLQKQADDALLNMEVVVCARDKPSKR